MKQRHLRFHFLINFSYLLRCEKACDLNIYEQMPLLFQFTFQFKGRNNEDINQEVVSDPNDNVVQYHVTKEGQDAYVVNDFNRVIFNRERF